VATLGGAPAGYALVLFRAGSGIARLYSILVDPRATGRGIGGRLLAAAEATASKRGAAVLRLEVNPRNRRAIRIYEAAGYRAFGRHEDYYEDGAPALRYAKTLALR
jgi:ribosomal protein S18 acetylase RimI-like enzyme